MKPGDKLRFRGPAGAEFVITVGVAFDQRTIAARVEAGEWKPVEPAAKPAVKRALTKKKPVKGEV